MRVSDTKKRKIHLKVELVDVKLKRKDADWNYWKSIAIAWKIVVGI